MKWLCPHCKAINAQGAGLCHNCAKKTPLPLGFDHPCRDYCSGWKQGYDAGDRAGFVRAAALIRQQGYNAAPDTAASEWADWLEQQSKERGE